MQTGILARFPEPWEKPNLNDGPNTPRRGATNR